MTDICVVGAGPAGLAVCESLLESGRTVCLVESGPALGGPKVLDGVELRADDPYPQGSVRESRAGGVGGTSRSWSFRLAGAGEDADAAPVGCRYVPLDPLDLEARPEIGTPGWPLTRTDLDPWYAVAQRFCQLGPFDYAADSWSDESARALPLDETGVHTSMFQFGPGTAFTKDARMRVEAAANVELRTDTQVVRLELDPSTRQVIGVHVVGPNGPELIRSGRVVLAAGTIENVRILLDTGRRSGFTPGNDHDLVGRYLMEHQLVRGGLLVTRPGSMLIRRLALYATRRVRGSWVSAALTLNPAVLRHEGLPACSALLVPRDESLGTTAAQAVAALRSPSGKGAPWPTRMKWVRTALRRPASVLRAARVVRGPQANLDRATWAGAEDASLTVFELLHQTEQVPTAENRLELSVRRDAHDRSEMALTWRWSELDRARVARARDLFASAFEQSGMGVVVQRDWDNGHPRMLGGTHHHLGGLRMSTQPHLGVVDPDCRVHGTDNLYVAGAAVFPSGGFANPTLTVTALGLRLGAHLAGLPPAVTASS